MVIIGSLAALVTGLAGRANDAAKRARVSAEKDKLVTFIEAYHSKLGYYPSDNGVVDKPETNRAWAQKNLLFYELLGSTYDPANNGQFTTIDTNIVTAKQFSDFYNVGGVRNSINPQRFYTGTLKATDFAPTNNPVPSVAILQFTVPVPFGVSTVPNFWYYDCSSTNRHNPETFDLWAVYTSGKNTITNGNWKD